MPKNNYNRSNSKNNNQRQQNPYITNDAVIGKNPNVQAAKPLQTNVDLENSFFDDLAGYGMNGLTDLSEFDSFSSTAQNRDQIYNMIDMMSEDSTIAAVLETYVEDATESNENRDIMWVTSDDPEVEKFVSYLLTSFNVNRNIKRWMYCLFKYGDVYLRLVRQSDEEKDLFKAMGGEEENTTEFAHNHLNEKLITNDLSKYDPTIEELNNLEDIDFNDKKFQERLVESTVLKVYSHNDPYAYRLEMVTNPAEMFELVQHDKTYAYIQTNVNMMTTSNVSTEKWMQGTNFLRFKTKSSETTIYQASEFVHGYLEGGNTRSQDQIQVFLQDSVDVEDTTDDKDKYIYNVRRGQSILYNTFRTWRELQLLEDSILLNRITKSSVTRILSIEVGDMSRENVAKHLNGVKSLIEQKSSIDVGNSIGSYTNPGPIENNVYIPTRNGMGAISTTNIGGDVDVKSLVDLDYFRDKLFGCVRGTTKILLANGEADTISNLYERNKQGETFTILSCDAETGEIEETNINDVMITRKSKSFIRIYTSDDNYIEVTPEHLILLSNGSYVEAQNLSENDEIVGV